jgi:hypothetical protein
MCDASARFPADALHSRNNAATLSPLVARKLDSGEWLADSRSSVSAAGHIDPDALIGDLFMQKWNRWQDWTNVVLGVILHCGEA